MNKKKFARIQALYRDGVARPICVASILNMSKTTTEAAVWVDKFYAWAFKYNSVSAPGAIIWSDAPKE